MNHAVLPDLVNDFQPNISQKPDDKVLKMNQFSCQENNTNTDQNMANTVKENEQMTKCFYPNR